MTQKPANQEWLSTSLGHSTPDSITVRGRDLAGELMGEMSFGDLAFFLAAGRSPSPAESKLFNAVLVSLADHGLTPSALAARLTYTGAPEAIQGALAAGLLGGGSVFLGPVEDTARFLTSALQDPAPDDLDVDAALEAAAINAVRTAVSNGQKVPGLGHPIHTTVDPRVPRLYDLARSTLLVTPHLRLLEKVAAAYDNLTGRELVINGAGAAGAALADLGFAPAVGRGFALLARTAGLIAHLVEEASRPMGMRLWKGVESRAAASPPGSEEAV